MTVEYEIDAGELAEYASWTELRNAVESNDGLVVTTMEKLRRVKGAGRLGKHVRDAITKDLASNGMGHLPPQLPEYQERPVRIYSLGSSISDVVNAIYSPTPDGDHLLREIGSSSAQDLVRQIRELICG